MDGGLFPSDSIREEYLAKLRDMIGTNKFTQEHYDAIVAGLARHDANLARERVRKQRKSGVRR